jgi:formamidopyrimidine-DNA glycosylase
VIHSIETRGHQFIINLEGFFIRIAFQLHGQVVICNEDIFEEIAHDKYHLGSIAWQLAIKLDDILPQPTVLLFVDYNRLMRIEIIVLQENVEKWGKGRNYDPIDEWKKYEREIRKQIPQLRKRVVTIFELVSKTELFNGFGANHTTEALHFARIHPVRPASDVFRSLSLTNRLLDGLYKASRIPIDWHKYVPKSPNLTAPFEFNDKAWKYYNSRLNKVYRKAKVLMKRTDAESISGALSLIHKSSYYS